MRDPIFDERVARLISILFDGLFILVVVLLTQYLIRTTKTALEPSKSVIEEQSPLLDQATFDKVIKKFE